MILFGVVFLLFSFGEKRKVGREVSCRSMKIFFLGILVKSFDFDKLSIQSSLLFRGGREDLG